MEELKRPTIPLFVALLETLSEQGFIDVGPTEGEYDCTIIYDFLVVSKITVCSNREKYWLHLMNPKICRKLMGILKNLMR